VMGESTSCSAQIVCGYLGCDARPFNPLLAALPRVLHASGTAGTLGTLFGFALAEARDATVGSESVLSLLSELMFVEVVRNYVRALPPERTGWLAALRDPVVAAALTAIHASPGRAWSVASLGHEVGASRSVLAERFTRLVGEPPMQYVARWRMQAAAHQLLSTTDTVAAVAERVGYESEAAFTRAFKKIVGTTPTTWRRRRAPEISSSAVRHGRGGI
jgi:AraC-like DNA-binding protein